MINLTAGPTQIIAQFSTFDALNGLKAAVHKELQGYVNFEKVKRIAELNRVGFKHEHWWRDPDSEQLFPK